MSSGTNSERIQQNNVKLGQIKTAVDELPEYQDIVPIYASGNDYFLLTFQNGTTPLVVTSIYGYEKYRVVQFKNDSSYYLYDVSENTPILLYESSIRLR